jgi:hypothetical protein
MNRKVAKIINLETFPVLKNFKRIMARAHLFDGQLIPSICTPNAP